MLKLIKYFRITSGKQIYSYPAVEFVLFLRYDILKAFLSLTYRIRKTLLDIFFN